MSGLPGNPKLAEVSKATQFQPGNTASVGNGRPKGSKNWSTIVQNLLFDEDFANEMTKSLKSNHPWWDKLPNRNYANIIVSTMMLKAGAGDKQAAEWLRKTGFGDKLDITTDGDPLNTPDASQDKADKFAAFMQLQVEARAKEIEQTPAVESTTTPPAATIVIPAVQETAPVAPMAPAAQPVVTPPIVEPQPPVVPETTPAPLPEPVIQAAVEPTPVIDREALLAKMQTATATQAVPAPSPDVPPAVAQGDGYVATR